MTLEHPGTCIQVDRLTRIETKLDCIDRKLTKHFSVEGTVGKMAVQVAQLAERQEGSSRNWTTLAWRAIAGLSLAILALVQLL
jgi:hypothetical protein